MPESGGTITVRLYKWDSSSQVWNEVGVKSVNYQPNVNYVTVSFTGTELNKYYTYEVYHKPSTGLKLEEFWGWGQTFILTSSNSSATIDFYRSRPIISSVDPYPTQVSTNSVIRFTVTVKNLDTRSRNLYLTAILDRDLSKPLDVTIDTSPFTLNPGEERSITVTIRTPSAPGVYIPYFLLRYYNPQDPDSHGTVYDQWDGTWRKINITTPLSCEARIDLSNFNEGEVQLDVARCSDVTGNGKRDAYIYIIVPSGASKLQVSMSVESDDDIDMKLYTPDGSLAGSSTRGTGRSEEIIVNNPAQGIWKLYVYEYSISGSTANIVVKARIEREQPKVEIVSVTPAGYCTHNGLPYLGIDVEGCKIKIRLRFTNAEAGSYYIIPLYYVDGLGYVEIPHTPASVSIFDRTSEQETEIKIAGFPLMGVSGEKRILLLVEHHPSRGSPRYVAEREITVYFSSNYSKMYFEKFSFSSTTIEDEFYRERYAPVIVFYFADRYHFDKESPFAVYVTLLREQKEPSEYRGKKIWIEGWIDSANLYLIYDRRKGPDRGEVSLNELLELSIYPIAFCYMRGVRADILWEKIDGSTLMSRLEGKKAVNFLLHTLMGLTTILPYIGPVFKFTNTIMDLLGLKGREVPQLSRIYSQFFDYKRYLIEPYIFVGMPECGSVRWVGINTELKFTREYNNGEITVIVLINDYYYYATSVRLNAG